MLYGKRLDQALKHAAKSRRELGLHLGMSPQNIGMIITNAKKTDQHLGSEDHAKAARYLRVNAHWLATGEGEMTGDGSQTGYELSVQAVELAELLDMIPVSDRVKRAKAFADATNAILSVLQPAGSTPHK